MNRIKRTYGQPLSPDGPWMTNPFTAVMSPTAAVKRAGAYSCPVYLGLLVQLPDPDGVGAVELIHAQYLRQLVELAPRSTNHFTIPRPVMFDLHGCPPVVGTALYDPEGTLESYGVLCSSRISKRPATTVEFASHQLLIKKPRVRV
ncbi:hypothetical protein HF680_15210 [Brevundimonas sp. WCHBH090558]|uniref:hypothetical protein n=1 Tax=Brevundimonas huaxiensis TaxID=2725493 RepID=UPI001625A9DC|nr:hypothetical protein [Brevundimonas huaxiensis]MBC1183990.1 hypothetical protein [Brevundimonas huaxiensis]